MASSDDASLFQRKYIDYVYVPALLLIVGTLIVKKEWTPYSALVALAFGIWNFNALSKCLLTFFLLVGELASSHTEPQRSRRS